MLRQQKLKTLILIILFSSATFAGGLYLGGRGYTVEVQGNPTKVEIVNRQTEQTPQNLDFGIFWQVWDILNHRHVDRPFDPQKLLQGALKGLTAATGDPYTAFLPPVENKEVKDNLNGRYEGIGAELGIRNSQLTVISPLDGSPAQAIGVQPGDVILKVNDEETAALALSEAVSKIRGPAGTTVVLTLRRGEAETFDVTIKREQITVKSISWEDKGDGVIYIRVSRFGEQTNKDWDQAVTDILSSIIHPPSSVILDVRSNPGGYLQASIHLASEFVNTGTVVFEEFGDGQRQEFKSDHRGRLTQVPVVVMINEGSASASEILAAALRDLKGATLVGQKSFGKGTVQDAVELGDGSAVHVTIARWLTPQGVNIDEQGLEPDFVVERTEEEVDAGVDGQLEKAVEMAKGMQ
jgi:carboxyl-terminal processing protease